MGIGKRLSRVGCLLSLALMGCEGQKVTNCDIMYLTPKQATGQAPITDVHWEQGHSCEKAGDERVRVTVCYDYSVEGNTVVSKSEFEVVAFDENPEGKYVCVTPDALDDSVKVDVEP